MPTTTLANAISAIMQAASLDGLLAEYDRLFTATSQPEPSPTPEPAPVFGVSASERKEANERVKALLARVGNNAALLTEDDKATLRQYSGLGGIGGSIHEYYTPQWVAEGIWDAMKAMGQGPGNYLEPSAGAGVFHGTKPAGAIMTATEIDETSSQVNQLLHPDDRVLNQCFEQLAVAAEDNSWDGAVGNVPFGETRGSYGAFDPEYAGIKYVDQYFVSRILDKIKPGALMTVVVPMRIVSGSRFKKWRAELSLKAEFLGAHRLPSGTFSNNGTDTATDILVMKKHPEGLADLVNGRKKVDLEAANVLWDTFINGKWFESPEGRRFLHGEQSVQGVGKFARTVVDKGATTNAQIKERLAHKFESRIDWLSLEVSEPVTPTYDEGDEAMINGRRRRLVDGEWKVVSNVGLDGDSISQEEYGVGSQRQLITMLAQSPLNALELTHAQMMAVHRDYPDSTEGVIQDAIKLANQQEPQHRARIVRGSIIGNRIQELLGTVNETGKVPAEEAAELRDLISKEIEAFGVSAADRKLAALGGGSGAGAWNAFVNATDVNGKFSDLLRGTLDRGDVRAYDDTDAAQTVAYLFGQLELNPVDLSDFLDLYRGEGCKTIADLAKVPGIAVTPDNMLMPLDRATSGNIVKTSGRLRAAMGFETDPAILANFQAQLDEIERRRYRAKVDDIEMTMAAKWLPRRYVAEFLKDQGYRELVYSKVTTDDDGNMVEDKDYQEADGVWSGYGVRDGKKRSNANEQFERQLENYLNGVAVRSGDAAGAAAYRARIKKIEERFAVWLRQHDDIDKLAGLYNDSFNGFVPFDHSDADLKLDSISGRIVPFGYQCSGIRRASEDGRGVLAFGTGLGKTTTALGLAAYNKQMGRAKRTGIAVPLAVLENWYHESKTFYSQEAFDKVFFVGLEPVRGKDGAIEQEPITDDQGNPRLGANGEALTRDKLKALSSKEVKARLNMIPQSNYDVVVMSKEQLASIPMRPESIIAHAERMEDAGLRAGKIKFLSEAKGHRDAMKREKFKEKHSDTGTEKKLDIPYWEDMGFDNLIVDEAHNYRNSYQAGRESSKLAYLPTQASAKMALDLAVKSSQMRAKNNGRGPVLLTATPTVNSPIDIFNMLSHILSVEEWGQLGISDVDDFIRVFGETEDVMVQKLSGEVETKQGLVGFRNLSGLRSLFHRWVNMKDAKDVSHTVTIPDLVEELAEADMTEEQAAVYEELRQRAEDLSSGKSNDENGTPTDSTFGIIRDMDRACTDMDLYRRTMTFRFPLKYGEQVQQLVADLPVSLKVDQKDDDKQDEEADKATVIAKLDAKVSTSAHAITLVVPEAYEKEVTERLNKFGITASDVSHPITPKYARMLENLKRGYEEGGKQLIFTEEKSQHEKLKRIIVNNLGIPAEQIGIINAQTVSGKDADGEQASLEGFAAAYNDGRIKVLICNKKAEVGVNLHHGTVAIHHLTLPWTPASIKQRNGRGARVGAKQKQVRVYYYVGKGSFDEFRLGSLKRKANWQNELFTSDAEKMKNADADDAMEASLLLARDPEERKARIEENQAKARAKIEEAAKRRANIDLFNYLKAAHDAGGDPGRMRTNIANLQQEITQLTANAAKAKEWAERYRGNAETDPYSKGYYLAEAKSKEREYANITESLGSSRKQLVAAERKLERASKSADALKRLRPTLEQSIKDGLIDVPAEILDKGTEFLTDGTNVIRVGRLYQYYGSIVQVESIDFDGKQARGVVLHEPVRQGKSAIHKVGDKAWCGVASLKTEVSYTPSELEVLAELSNRVSLSRAAQLLDEGLFTQYFQSGTLALAVSGDYYLLHGTGADAFEVIRHESYSDTPMAPQKRARIVYPDAGNAGLKAKLAKWLLEDRIRFTADRYSSNRVATDWLKLLYGDNVEASVEAYGEIAPEQVINEWLAKMMDGHRKDCGDNLRYLGNGGIFANFAEPKIPTEWSNRTAFKEAIERGKPIMEKEAEEKKAAEQARRNAAMAANFTIHQQDNDDEARHRRLSWLIRRYLQTGSNNEYMAVSDLKKDTDGHPYRADGAFQLSRAVSDLIAAGFAEELGEVTETTLDRAWSTGLVKLLRNQGDLTKWSEEKTPYPELARTAEQTDDKAGIDLRLSWLIDAFNAHRLEGHRMRKIIRAFEDTAEGPYMAQGSFNSLLAVSDMASIGLVEMPQPANYAPVMRALEAGLTAMEEHPEKMPADLPAIEHVPTPEELEAQAAEEARKSAEAKAALLAATGETKLDGGIVVRPNAAAINKPSSKYQSRGRWRTSPAVNKAVGSVIGLQDPRGTAGVLKARKELLKSAFPGTFFCEDVSDEYPGSWWFVPASATIEQIANVLGIYS